MCGEEYLSGQEDGCSHLSVFKNMPYMEISGSLQWKTHA